jgi:hypothetical protein
MSELIAEFVQVLARSVSPEGVTRFDVHELGGVGAEEKGVQIQRLIHLNTIEQSISQAAGNPEGEEKKRKEKKNKGHSPCRARRFPNPVEPC